VKIVSEDWNPGDDATKTMSFDQLPSKRSSSGADSVVLWSSAAFPFSEIPLRKMRFILAGTNQANKPVYVTLTIDGKTVTSASAAPGKKIATSYRTAPVDNDVKNHTAAIVAEPSTASLSNFQVKIVSEDWNPGDDATKTMSFDQLPSKRSSSGADDFKVLVTKALRDKKVSQRDLDKAVDANPVSKTNPTARKALAEQVRKFLTDRKVVVSGDEAPAGDVKVFRVLVTQALRDKKMSRDDFNKTVSANLPPTATRDERTLAAARVLRFLEKRGVRVG
jgi:hypothetical protein